MASNIPTFDCDDPWFTKIEQGEKPLEGRKGKPQFAQLNPGDIIRFRCTQQQDRTFEATVEKIDRFKTIREYLETVGVQNALPGTESLEEALRIYSDWNAEEDVARYGFLAIWVKVSKKS
jgi:ASC-1-like (ASCH) protein